MRNEQEPSQSFNAASDIEVNDVRIRMHGVREGAIEGFHELGQTTIDGPNHFAMDLALYGKPDAWDRQRVCRNQLYFDSTEDLKSFLGSLKEAIAKIEAKELI
mgnify:FL=1